MNNDFTENDITIIDNQFKDISDFIYKNTMDNYLIKNNVDVKQKPVKKIHKYKVKNNTTNDQIEVGDQVVDKDTIKAVVLDIDDDEMSVFTENGCVEIWSKENVTKTGVKHNIDKILDELRNT